jgi:DNA-binding CsgD family transcriptional regulator
LGNDDISHYTQYVAPKNLPKLLSNDDYSHFTIYCVSLHYMEPSNNKHLQHATELRTWWSHQSFADISPKELPKFLTQTPLIHSIADKTKTVVQIYDMNDFKPIYASPNCIDICGFTPEELNSKGFIYWISTVPMKEIYFFIRSSRFVTQQLSLPESDSFFFSNQVINMTYKNKAGEKRKMLTTNSCLEFTPEGKQRFQLILWQDMTHRSKSDEIVARFRFNENIFYNFESIKGKFTNGDLLTERELEIVTHTVKGLSSKELSDLLFLSQHTVDNHKKNIMNKLQVKTMGDVIEVCSFIGVM